MKADFKFSQLYITCIVKPKHNRQLRLSSFDYKTLFRGIYNSSQISLVISLEPRSLSHTPLVTPLESHPLTVSDFILKHCFNLIIQNFLKFYHEMSYLSSKKFLKMF